MRRQVHVSRHCDFRAELCEIEDVLLGPTGLYAAIQLTPPVDDLEPFLYDVHRLQQDILKHKIQVRLSRNIEDVSGSVLNGTTVSALFYVTLVAVVSFSPSNKKRDLFD